MSKQEEEIFQNGFDFVSITLASPETIRGWSHGEVKNPETINYRTFKPEKGGLFCEKIFGPTKDWECACGKYKRIKHKGVICDRCGVEVTQAKVRRERMGHIELAVPVSHLWFFKCLPSRLGLVLGMTGRELERVLYYEDYVVVDPGDTPLKVKQRLNEEEYREALDKYGESFIAKMGAEGIRDILANLDLDEELEQLASQLEATSSKQNKKNITRRIKVIDSFRENHIRPEWMILTVLPVIPPDLRPLVPLEGGRFATSDLNDLYRRVINRNNRLKQLLQLKTPDVIVRNEKRMLQEAVDALFDNGRHGRAVNGPGGRALKSLADMLKGKQGRFRQNLLGKRVDYSGRSVIVVGPTLHMNQCGLPKKMALTLFEPFIIRKLKDMGIVHTVRSGKKMIEREEDVVWDVLEGITKGHTVMLNRAPTLHRLSIQSFEPVLIEGEAIRLHPLVCTAYNADFDGDQMAVHVPLSVEAQLESKLIMLSTNNIFAPSSGKPITTPTQDIALGCYYFTIDSQADRLRARDPAAKKDAAIEHLPIFCDALEVHTAYDEGAVKLHDRIRFRNPDYRAETRYGSRNEPVVTTTPGRVFFNEIWPAGMGFCNFPVPKKKLEELILHCYQISGHDETVATLDRIKALGYEAATRAGISIGIQDMIVPKEKAGIVEEARGRLEEVNGQYKRGVITSGERYNKIIDIWTGATDEIASHMFSAMERNNGGNDVNPLFMMVDSGARGNKQQIRQLAGMRGLMARPSGEIIERPILANFREGLSVFEYYISTHGARKGLADTALKTAESGYMTRKLVDVAQDVIIVEEDCGTLNGIEIRAIKQGDDELVPLHKRVLGRTALDDVRDPASGEVIVAAGQEIDEKIAERIKRAGLDSVRIRSVLTCESKHGVCAKCYGRNLAYGKSATLGESVGIIAAQSIGEPGTQLTMRTFHIGGTASTVASAPEIVLAHTGILHFEDIRCVAGQEEGTEIVLNKNGIIHVMDPDTPSRELESHTIQIGSILRYKDGDRAEKGELLASWDAYNIPILTERAGLVDFRDFIEKVTYRIEHNDETGTDEIVVFEHKDEIHPQVLIRDPENAKTILNAYTIPANAHVTVKKGELLSAGSVLAKTPRKEQRTRDITGGLPRVAELFDARQPKDAAEIAKIDGIVEFGANTRGKRKIIVRDPVTGDEEEHLIAVNKTVVVYEGDHVRKGQELTEGSIVPQELLDVCGPQELQEYLLNEVQQVYRLQGVEINDKHIEIIVRQMLRKVRIIEPGDTGFLWGEMVDKQTFQDANRTVMEEGGTAAEAQPVLLGITKASLETESFISAASFQDTTRILTSAATLSKTDTLQGFKENVIMGHLIPAGTGFQMYRDIKLVPLADPLPPDESELKRESEKADLEFTLPPELLAPPVPVEDEMEASADASEGNGEDM